MDGYDAATRAATALLLQQRLHSLAIDVTRLRYERAIRFDSMQRFCTMTRTTMDALSRSRDTRDGLILHRLRGDDTVSIVLYNEDMPNRRRRNFTLAHEIGHIYLNHQEDNDEAERQADRFAAQLLLPEILVWELTRLWRGALSADDVCGIFNVSHQAAAARLAGLHTRGHLVVGEDDRALLRRFGGLLPRADGPVITV